jgi:hypothetical protein
VVLWGNLASGVTLGGAGLAITGHGAVAQELPSTPGPEDVNSTITHRQIETNGISMHIAEAGTGPLVVLVHGWPEPWYSWRHQLPALAAGYHAVAPISAATVRPMLPSRSRATACAT